MKVSLILPIYNEEAILQEVLAKYIKDLKSLACDYEVIAVNDGCTDGSLNILKSAAKLNRSLRIINFDARYGKQAAITAGMDAVDIKSDAVIIADVDILNPVGIVKMLVGEYKQGHQIVHAKRERVGFSRLRFQLSNKLVKLGSRLFGIHGEYVGKVDVALYSQSVVDVIKALPAKNKFLRSMNTWVGWDIKEIEFASGYNKDEEGKKLHESKERLHKQGKEPVTREKAREHTSSLIYNAALFAMSLIVLGVAIFFATGTHLGFVYHFFAWLVFVGLFLIGIMFWARAVLIKRVGVIHNNMTEKIYKIANVIN